MAEDPKKAAPPARPAPPAPPPPPSRREVALAALSLPMEALEAQCEMAFFIASGPGGQHRNKTESGVRLTHASTGITVTATERRSQHQNRGVALERLRERLQALTFVQKKRKKTRPSLGAKRRRIEGKKHVSQKKKDRKNFD